MKAITLEELNDELRTLTQSISELGLTTDQVAERLKNLALEISRGRKGLINTDVVKEPFPAKIECPVFQSCAYRLNEAYQWSLEYTTKKELVLVPRIKASGTHGDADYYLEGGDL